MAISLKRIVSQKEVSSLLDSFCKAMGAQVAILGVNGQLLVGTHPENQEFKTPVEVAGELLGWVLGNEKSSTVADFLKYLVEQEIEKKALAKEVLDKYREVNLLYALSDKFTACLDVKEIANTVLTEARKIVKADNVSLMLLNRDQTLEVLCAFGEDSQTKVQLSPGKGIAGSILVNENAEIVNDVLNDERFIPGHTAISSLICVPLKSQNGAIGVLNISSKEPCTYTAQDLKFATGIASVAASAIENALLHENKLQEERIKSQLERYIPPQLVDAIISEKGAELSLAPTKKNIAILFSDIRNFTTKCEELPPETIVRYLNEYFTEMVDVIFRHDGTVNKFVGDMIVAMFGAPSILPDNEKQAISAAIEMQLRLKNLSIPWIRENFLTGIGISSGEVVIGNIGSPQHLDYTAIGDEVNLASRLQGLAEGGQILVSSSVYETTKNYFTYREVGNVTVKGKRKSVNVFEVIY